MRFYVMEIPGMLSMLEFAKVDITFEPARASYLKLLLKENISQDKKTYS